ncbi:MAG: hypothetical protein GX067_04770 [Clostridiales bacterium]|jgi:hypothetical protein|nr:hypothetical protein [Clostridiales bacterium]
MAKKGMKRPDVRDTHGSENKQAKQKRAETASIPEALNIFDNKNNNPAQNNRNNAENRYNQAEDKSNNARNAKHNEPQENKGQTWNNQYK